MTARTGAASAPSRRRGRAAKKYRPGSTSASHKPSIQVSPRSSRACARGALRLRRRPPKACRCPPARHLDQPTSKPTSPTARQSPGRSRGRGESCLCALGLGAISAPNLEVGHPVSAIDPPPRPERRPPAPRSGRSESFPLPPQRSRGEAVRRRGFRCGRSSRRNSERTPARAAD